MIYKPEKNYFPYLLEKKIQEYWYENKIYEKTKKLKEKCKDYYFIDGPPYTSGSIHIGTAWNKILKDAFIRYKRMQKNNIRDQPGFDMHGLPIEVNVEQSLNIKNKKEIERYGIDNFITKCKESAKEYQKTMTEEFKELGVWLDWEHPYLTITNEYIESAWWSIKKAYEKNLLYHSERVVTWCPRCETALAEAEVEYWDETDPSIYVKYKIENTVNEYLVIWTTTPWTIPSDLAVAIHPEFYYVKVAVEKDNMREIWIVLEERYIELADIAGYHIVSIIDRFKGSKIEGIKYVHPLIDEVPYLKRELSKWKHCVVLADYVTTENTGLVHTSPGHGPDDFETGVRYSLPAFCPVDSSGVFTDDAGKYKNMFIKDADNLIIKDLESKKLILYAGKITHRYGHCWRCKTPITYRATKQWFLKITALKNKMLDEIDRVKWYPEWAGSARQKNWIENARDWCISRQRYWGIPIPLWICSCGEKKVIGSIEELKKKYR